VPEAGCWSDRAAVVGLSWEEEREAGGGSVPIRCGRAEAGAEADRRVEGGVEPGWEGEPGARWGAVREADSDSATRADAAAAMRVNEAGDKGAGRGTEPSSSSSDEESESSDGDANVRKLLKWGGGLAARGESTATTSSAGGFVGPVAYLHHARLRWPAAGAIVLRSTQAERGGSNG
jgi:hypothetical protein